MSAESVRELIVGYRNKGLCSKRWKSVEAMVTSIEKGALHQNTSPEERTYADLCTIRN